MIIPYKIRKVWDEIRWYFNPRQKWLTRKIPNSWIDKDTLWEICILEGIKHFVEQDGGLGYDGQNDPTYPEWQKAFDIKVRFYYEMITKKLPELEKQMEEAWKNIPVLFSWEIPIKTIDYNKTYGEVDRIEKEIHDLKTEIMVWAVTQRDCIWT
jgi:hypothetical protein